MGKRFIKVIEGHEISLTRKGANQHATVVLLKSATPQTPETTDMDYNLLKTVASFSDVEKAYFATLSEEAGTAFCKAAPEQRSALAASWKAEQDKAALEAEASKSGVSVEVVELRKANEDLAKRNEANEARIAELEKKDKEATLRKAAEASEYSGYPGGADAVVEILRAAEKLDDTTKDVILKNAKATAAAARRTGHEYGLSAEDRQTALSKSAPAKAAYEAAIADVMKTDKVTRSVAVKTLREDPSKKDIIAAVFAEEGLGA